MIRIYHSLFYYTYINISKTNSLSAKSSSARIVSLCFLINVFSIYFILFEEFNSTSFYLFFIIAITISTLNLWYFAQKNKAEEIVNQFKFKQTNLFWRYSIKFYPDISILTCIKSFSTDSDLLLKALFVIIVARLIMLFVEM